MKRRGLLQLLGYGTLSIPLAAWADTLGEWPSQTVGAVATGAPRGEARTKSSFDLLDSKPYTCCRVCVGLGPEAETLVDALPARSTGDAIDDGFFYQRGTDPETIAAWAEASPFPCDLVVLVIDARDPQALAATPFWAARLADQGALRAAIIIGDDARDPDAPWRRELIGRFDGVIDVCPQRGALRTAAVASLTDGLLLLTPSFIACDIADVLPVLHAGPNLRTAATAWSHAATGLIALRKLWATLQPARADGSLAFFHCAHDFSLQEFHWLHDQIMELLPDDNMTVFTFCCHPEWPTGRRVLGWTLLDSGQTSAARPSTT